MIVSTEQEVGKKVSTPEEYYKALSIIAHNGQGPIRYIHYITQYTLNNWGEMSPDDLLSCAQIINEAAKNIDSMLSNLMVWARMKEGALKANYTNVCVSKVISEEANLFEPFLQLKKITIERDLSNDVVAYTDEYILRIVFQNLLSNAIKYSPQKSVIKVCTARNAGGDIEISVTDFGNGFSFTKNTPFEPKEGTLHEIGSGYGLSLTRSLLERIGGILQLYSEPKQPTTVTIVLPTRVIV